MPGPKFKKITDDAKNRIREISVSDAAKRLAEGAVLIDVREADEFAKGHAKGAIGLSKGVLELKIEEIVPDESKPIMCYCGGGSRSALAAENLQRMGYKDVASVAGGFKAWREQGLPTE
jgi:rhodanese-related sulfurtransferase